jgi:hypothetical protein
VSDEPDTEPEPWAEMDKWLDENYACLYWGCDDEHVSSAIVDRLIEAIAEWGRT